MAYTKTTWVDGVEGNTPINATNLNNIEDGVEANDTNISTMLDDLYYVNNEEDTFNNLVLAGHVSGGGAQIIFSIPTPKSLKNINTITILDGSISVRGTAGYVENSGSSPYLSMTDTTSYTYTLIKLTDNMFNIGISKSVAFSNVTNNTPVAIQLRNVKFKFTQSS